MHLLLIIVAVLVVAVAVVLVIAAGKPGDFRVERSAAIKAGADKIFPYISDFHNWTSWSPWEKLDREMNKSYSGAAGGTGAIYEWSGNKKVGAGRMEILESSQPVKLMIRLEFLRPFRATNTTEFKLLPQGDSAEVTWAMHGPLPFAMKIMHVFMNMDRMIGRDFEEGLANLKVIAEK